MRNIEEQLIIEPKQNEKLSTLQLWQAHLRALSLASKEKKHTVEVFDTSEQSSSSVVVNLTNSQPAP
jgi:hypothetical protein